MATNDTKNSQDLPNTYEMNPEERAAWDLVERRVAQSLECIARVSESGDSHEIDTCWCCGYPWLYYNEYEFGCYICGWVTLFGGAPDAMHEIFHEKGVELNQAQARLNFVRTGWCFPPGSEHRPKIEYSAERSALILALDALLADGTPISDQAHWTRIRAAFNALSNLVNPDPDPRFSRMIWKFAAKVDSNGRFRRNHHGRWEWHHAPPEWDDQG